MQIIAQPKLIKLDEQEIPFEEPVSYLVGQYHHSKISGDLFWSYAERLAKQRGIKDFRLAVGEGYFLCIQEGRPHNEFPKILTKDVLDTIPPYAKFMRIIPASRAQDVLEALEQRINGFGFLGLEAKMSLQHSSATRGPYVDIPLGVDIALIAEHELIVQYQ